MQAGIVDPQNIRSAQAVDCVQPKPRINDVVAVIARQNIAGVAAKQVFKAGQRVAFRVAAHADDAIDQTDRDAGVRRGVVRPVRSVAAVQVICASAARDRVVARQRLDLIGAVAAVDPVVGEITGERVVAARAFQILKRADRDRPRLRFRVEPGACDLIIVFRPVLKNQRREARNNACFAGPDIQVVIGQQIAVAFPGRGAAAIQHVAVTPGDDRVVAAASLHGVAAFASFKHVVAREPVQKVVALIAPQLIFVHGAVQPLNPADNVSFGICAIGDAIRQIDRNAAARGDVAEQVVAAAAAIDDVGAPAADDEIRAVAAMQRVVAVLPVQRVVVAFIAVNFVTELRADDVFDIGQKVALGQTACAVYIAAIAGQEHRGVRGGIVDLIDAFAALDPVAAGAGADDVIAIAAIDHIGAAAAAKDVVIVAAVQAVIAVAAQQHVFANAAGQTGADFRAQAFVNRQNVVAVAAIADDPGDADKPLTHAKGGDDQGVAVKTGVLRDRVAFFIKLLRHALDAEDLVNHAFARAIWQVAHVVAFADVQGDRVAILGGETGVDQFRRVLTIGAFAAKFEIRNRRLGDGQDEFP